MCEILKPAQGDLWSREPAGDGNDEETCGCERNVAEEMMDCYQYGSVSGEDFLRSRDDGGHPALRHPSRADSSGG